MAASKQICSIKSREQSPTNQFSTRNLRNQRVCVQNTHCMKYSSTIDRKESDKEINIQQTSIKEQQF